MSELQEAVALLVSRLVHDLKNPLAAVLTNLQFLEGSVGGASEREALDESLVSASRLDRMLDDVVDLARLRSGELAPVPAPVELSALAAELAEKVAPLRGNRSLQLEVPAIRLVTDRALLSRVLINLLEHALRQTPSRGMVVLQGQRGEDGLALRVIDGGGPFGPGIQPSFLDDQLPLKQAPPHGYRSDQGLGLHFAGLAARTLGARTVIEERSDGVKGVVFALLFPPETLG